LAVGQSPQTVAIPMVDLIVLLTLENSYNTRVATLVDADQTPGSYVINFNAGLYPSGVYFIVLDIKGSNNQDSSITRNTTIFRP
jgi:hypothetical protein